jgi:hypothetical protein
VNAVSGNRTTWAPREEALRRRVSMRFRVSSRLEVRWTGPIWAAAILRVRGIVKAVKLGDGEFCKCLKVQSRQKQDDEILELKEKQEADFLELHAPSKTRLSSHPTLPLLPFGQSFQFPIPFSASPAPRETKISLHFRLALQPR